MKILGGSRQKQWHRAAIYPLQLDNDKKWKRITFFLFLTFNGMILDWNFSRVELLDFTTFMFSEIEMQGSDHLSNILVSSVWSDKSTHLSQNWIQIEDLHSPSSPLSYPLQFW